MNSKTLSALFFIIPALFLVSSPVMAASSVIINLNGKIKEGTCKVGNYTQNVSLTGRPGERYNSRLVFPRPGSTTRSVPFTIELKDCDPALNVSIRFDGPVLTGRNDILMLTQEASVSKGAGIQILDKNENLPAIGQKNTLMADVKKDETYIFPFFARYIRYSNDFVTEGSADGKVDSTFICE
ncbi:type 1 fimbrial protein [Morganella morganii]|uniref:fimbrial protein n=1 Tax=Morganella morganii TaxID=582 RepID=UPI00164AA248|nr:fimbrial protein [Morganella morganii]MBC4011848.1 type 1 fimbrial protein [Morganella morganii]